MQKFLIKILYFLGLFLYLPISSMAWGMLGHRIVGEIADSYLTPKARKEIRQILGTETIAIASNWADFIKSDTGYRYLNKWHYVDFENNLSYNEFKASLDNDKDIDAFTGLKTIIKQLKNKNLSKEKKVYYLKLLIHIAGDLHQPLHVSAAGDQGGNDIKVSWFNQPSNLHRVWDEQLIEYQQLSYTEYTAVINHPTLKQRNEWQKQPIEKWLYESYKLSEQLRGSIKREQKLSYQYNFEYIATLNSQLLKGGVRLAGLLNKIFV